MLSLQTGVKLWEITYSAPFLPQIKPEHAILMEIKEQNLDFFFCKYPILDYKLRSPGGLQLGSYDALLLN